MSQQEKQKKFKKEREERKNIMRKRLLALGIAAVLGVNIASTSVVWAADKVEITNVSYDPTRELYEQYNKVFAEHWKETVSYTHLKSLLLRFKTS